MGHAHAIYNATDRPVQWMNINVTAFKGVYDAFDLNDGRVGATIEPVPQFMTMHLDRALLKPVEAMNGGKGTVQYRRALDPTVFSAPGAMWITCCCRRAPRRVRAWSQAWAGSIT